MDIIIADTPSNNLSISNDIQSVQIITNETSNIIVNNYDSSSSFNITSEVTDIIFTDIGNQGIVGAKGDKGDKGDKFVFSDFTNEQVESLKVKGDKGDKGNTGDSLMFLWNSTSLGIKLDSEINYNFIDLKGSKGDTGNNLVFEDLTEDQKNELRGDVGSTSTNLVNMFYDSLLS